MHTHTYTYIGEYYLSLLLLFVCSLAINHGVLALIFLSLCLSLFYTVFVAPESTRVVNCNLLIDLMPYCYYFALMEMPRCINAALFADQR